MITHVCHRWFDEWQGTATPRLRALVEKGAALVAQYERDTEPRQRQRRLVDERHYRTAIEVIVCNLAHAVLHPPSTGRLAVLTGNGSSGFNRYENRALGTHFRTLLWHFEGIGWLTLERGYRDRPAGGVASSIAPTSIFTAKVHEAGIRLTDFGRIEGEEVIISSRKASTERGELIRRTWVDYPETGTTRALRDTMKSQNAFLAQADIAFLDDGLGTVDLQNRVQRRYFLCDGDHQPSFIHGGRLYGGEWQNLPRSRRARIRIEGEPIVILDYSAMAPCLAYASVGMKPPPGDIYALPGLDPTNRPAVKKAFNTLLCDTFPRKRGWPEPKAGDPRLPRSWSVPRFRDALLDRHPALLPCLGTGMAPHLQNMESTILIEVLGEVKARAIPVLSLHDGVLCPVSKAAEVRTLMEDAALSITSFNIPVAPHPLPAL